jgi:DNA-binding MarR family transcriptional regulator
MAQLDNIIHQPVRLQIMSSLVSLDQNEHVNFTYLRKLLKLTDGNLGAHLTKLEEAGYVKIDKAFIARKPQTFIRATGKGRDAFDNHIAALKEIVKGSGTQIESS